MKQSPIGNAIPAHAALLLDLDGTLLDIAPRPDAVVVPPELPPSLMALRFRLGGALAVVTGRPVEQVDALLPGIPTAVAGEHGGALRYHPNDPIERPALPDLDPAWREQASRVAAGYQGVFLEMKARGLVLHYRQEPEAGPALRQALLSISAGHETSYVVMAAHMAWELKPRGADKGTAVAALMARPPFAGRVPVYVGDDITDEDGIRMARLLGGVGLRVQDAFDSPAGVRRWLAEIASSPAEAVG
jgi:trehalose 6-phosphate phosphatase